MILEIILKWAITTLLTGLLGYVVKETKSNKKNNHTMKDSMVLILRSQIVSKCEKYIEIGYLPDYARSCIDDLFTQYTNLGGNHGVHLLVEQCFKLPPIKKGE